MNRTYGLRGVASHRSFHIACQCTSARYFRFPFVFVLASLGLHSAGPGAHHKVTEAYGLESRVARPRGGHVQLDAISNHRMEPSCHMICDDVVRYETHIHAKTHRTRSRRLASAVGVLPVRFCTRLVDTGQTHRSREASRTHTYSKKHRGGAAHTKRVQPYAPYTSTVYLDRIRTERSRARPPVRRRERGARRARHRGATKRARWALSTPPPHYLLQGSHTCGASPAPSTHRAPPGSVVVLVDALRLAARLAELQAAVHQVESVHARRNKAGARRRRRLLRRHAKVPLATRGEDHVHEELRNAHSDGGVREGREKGVPQKKCCEWLPCRRRYGAKHELERRVEIRLRVQRVPGQPSRRLTSPCKSTRSRPPCPWLLAL